MGRRLFHGWVVVAVTAIVVDYIATVPPTVALSADRFGRHNVGVVYGWIFAAHLIGAAIAAHLIGAAIAAIAARVAGENVGDYAAAFVAAGWIAIIAGSAVLAIRRERPDAPGEPGLPTRPAEARA